jgi:hypothetical protein
MTRLVPVAGLALAAHLSAGCLVMSLQPVYDESAIIFDDKLLGHWENIESRVTALVERGEWKSYKITYTDHFGTSAYVGYLTTIGDQRFLDVTPAHGLEAGYLLAPGHVALRLRWSGETLNVIPLEYDWFLAQAQKPAAAAKPLGRLQYGTDGKKNLVLASDTAELRSWIQTHLASPEPFSDARPFVKRK